MPSVRERELEGGVDLWHSIAARLADPIVAIDRPVWGFTGRTYILTLRSGERIVAKIAPDGVTAQRVLEATRVLAARGVAVPRIISVINFRRTAVVLTAHVHGQPGPELLASGTASPVAEAMGELARRLRMLGRLADLRIDEAWTSPAALAGAADEWSRSVVDTQLRQAVIEALALVSRRAWQQVCVHGDYVPANVLMTDGRVAALVDLDAVRNAHPLEDVAWWGLVMRHHHRALFDDGFRRFVAAAGLAQASADVRLLPHVALLIGAQRLADGRVRTGRAERQLLLTAMDWVRGQGA